jgi:hypothetical protein
MKVYKNNRYQPLKVWTGYRWVKIPAKSHVKVNVDQDSDHALALAEAGYLTIKGEPRQEDKAARTNQRISPSARRAGVAQ